MTDLDDLFAASRESRDWDLTAPPGMVATAIQRGRRRRFLRAVGGGAAVALTAVTLFVYVANADAKTDPSAAAAHARLVTDNRVQVLAQKLQALDAWEASGADRSVAELPNVRLPLEPRPEQETAVGAVTVPAASDGSVSVRFTGGPTDGVCAWDYVGIASETRHGVVITMLGHARPPGPHGNMMCAQIGYARTATVNLQAPLGERTVFDGTTGQRLPVDNYAPTLPTPPPTPTPAPTDTGTATASYACSSTEYQNRMAGNTLVAFECADGVVVYLRRNTHSAPFSASWVSEVLQLMVAVPTTEDDAAGVGPAIPREFAQATVAIVGKTLTIELPAGFDKRNGMLSSSANSINLLMALTSTFSTAKTPFTTVRITIGGSCAKWAAMMEAEPKACAYPLP